MIEADNWTCPRCNVRFRHRSKKASVEWGTWSVVEKSYQAERSLCTVPKCGVRFWHGGHSGSQIKARMYVDPNDCDTPIAEIEDPALLAAIREPLDRYLAEKRGRRAA